MLTQHVNSRQIRTSMHKFNILSHNHQCQETGFRVQRIVIKR